MYGENNSFGVDWSKSLENVQSKQGNVKDHFLCGFLLQQHRSKAIFPEFICKASIEVISCSFQLRSFIKFKMKQPLKLALKGAEK